MGTAASATTTTRCHLSTVDRLALLAPADLVTRGMTRARVIWSNRVMRIPPPQ
jgi:hypothetical protein